MGFFTPFSSSPKEAPKTTPPPPPEKPKSDSIFGGGLSATRKQRIRWMEEHRNDIYGGTKHHVGKKGIRDYEKKLFPQDSKEGDIIEKRRHEDDRIIQRMGKKITKMPSGPGKYEAKRDFDIINKMFGSGGKRKNN